MVYAKSAEGQTLACRYDAENLRYEIEENQELVRFIYNNQREAFTEVNANDTIRYIRGRNIISSDSVNAQTYYHYSCDEMGSITEVIDTGCSERTVLNHYQYDAFGLVTEGYENTPNRFKYTGEQYDKVTSQYYLRARYYNPVIARFMQEDTYHGDGLNLYVYCKNSPLEYVDPSGFASEGVSNGCKSGKYSADFNDLAAYRRQQGMPIAGSVEDKHTAAKLIIGDNVYYGRNGHGKQNEVTSVFTVNPQTATHAEGDVFYQAKMAGNTNTTAVLITDRCACRACGFNGGIRSLAKQMGITDLTIVSPGHDPINFNPQVKPIPNPFK